MVQDISLCLSWGKDVPVPNPYTIKDKLPIFAKAVLKGRDPLLEVALKGVNEHWSSLDEYERLAYAKRISRSVVRNLYRRWSCACGDSDMSLALKELEPMSIDLHLSSYSAFDWTLNGTPGSGVRVGREDAFFSPICYYRSEGSPEVGLIIDKRKSLDKLLKATWELYDRLGPGDSQARTKLCDAIFRLVDSFSY